MSNKYPKNAKQLPSNMPNNIPNKCQTNAKQQSNKCHINAKQIPRYQYAKQYTKYAEKYITKCQAIHQTNAKQYTKQCQTT